MLTHISQLSLSHSLHDSAHIITHDFLSFLVCFRFFFSPLSSFFLSANYSIRFLHNRSVFKFALNRFRYQAILQFSNCQLLSLPALTASACLPPPPLALPPHSTEKKAHLNFHLHFPMPEQEIAKRKRQPIKSYKYGRDTSPAKKNKASNAGNNSNSNKQQQQQQRGAFGATAPRPRRVGAFIKMHINFNNCRVDQVRRL